MEFNWACLPQLAITEIFSYLSQNERIRASSVCRSWRPGLFYPLLWKDLKIVLTNHSSIDRGIFLSRHIPLQCVTSLVITFDEKCCFLQEVLVCLSRLRLNSKLKCLKLLPTQIITPQKDMQTVICTLADALESLITKQSELQELDFGYFHTLVSELLRRKLTEQLPNTKKLQTLNIATVKPVTVMGSSCLSNTGPIPLQSLKAITRLGIDYQYISDEILIELSKPERLTLTELHIVAQLEGGSFETTSDYAWHTFKLANPKCQLHMSVVRSKKAVELLHSDILQPSMPLASLSTYFCRQVNVSCLHALSRWYDRSLQTLCIVDPLYSDVDNYLRTPDEIVPHLLPPQDSVEDDVDPLVMIAWKCKQLKSITLIGYQYSDTGLVGIARLQGPELKELNIPSSCIYYESNNRLIKEVSQALGKKWRPLRKHQLDKSLTDPNCRWDSYIFKKMSLF